MSVYRPTAAGVKCWCTVPARNLDVLVVDWVLKLEVFAAVSQTVVFGRVRNALVAVSRCSSPAVVTRLDWCQVPVVVAGHRRIVVQRSSDVVCRIVAAKNVVVVGHVLSRSRQKESSDALWRRHQGVQRCRHGALSAHAQIHVVSRNFLFILGVFYSFAQGRINQARYACAYRAPGWTGKGPSKNDMRPKFWACP